MNAWRSGTRLWSRASARTSSSDGSTSRSAAIAAAGPPASAAAGNEHLFGVAQAAPATVQQDDEVVEQVGRLVVDAVVGLLARRASDLLGLLHHLLADQR